MMPVPERVYYATLERWIDGDTPIVVVDQGFDDTTREHLRLKDCWVVDTQPRTANEAYDWVMTLAPPGTLVVIETFRPRPETFGRYVAVVWVPSQELSINAYLVAHGLATRARP